jgi:hypothetical protein
VTAAFVYDGNGARVKATIGATPTVYIGTYDEITGGVAKKHYYAGATRLAVRDASA